MPNKRKPKQPASKIKKVIPLNIFFIFHIFYTVSPAKPYLFDENIERLYFIEQCKFTYGPFQLTKPIPQSIQFYIAYLFSAVCLDLYPKHIPRKYCANTINNLNEQLRTKPFDSPLYCSLKFCRRNFNNSYVSSPMEQLLQSFLSFWYHYHQFLRDHEHQQPNFAHNIVTLRWLLFVQYGSGKHFVDHFISNTSTNYPTGYFFYRNLLSRKNR